MEGTAIAVLASVAVVLSASAGAADVVSASSLIRTADRAIATQGSAHVTFFAHSGSKTERIVADVGTNSGKEVVSEGKATITADVTGSRAYVEGNAEGLVDLFGLSSAEAKKLGHDWEVWTPGTSAYKNIKGDVTIGSVSELLPKAKGTTVSTEVRDGTTYSVLTWTIAATSSNPKLTNRLTVSMATTLPVDELTSGSDGFKVSTALSAWGQPVIVSPPASTSTRAASKL